MSYTLEVDMLEPGAARNAMRILFEKYRFMSTIQDVPARWIQEYPRSYLAKHGPVGIWNWKNIVFYTEHDATMFILRYS